MFCWKPTKTGKKGVLGEANDKSLTHKTLNFDKFQQRKINPRAITLFTKVITVLTINNENYTSTHSSKHTVAMKNQDLVIGDL